MAAKKFRVKAKAFINNRIYEEGEIVEYDGPAEDHLEEIKGGKFKSKDNDLEDSGFAD